MTPVSISAAGTDCAARTSDTAIAAVRVKTLLGFILFVCIVRILYLSLPPDDPGAVNGAVHTNIVKKSTVTYNTPNLFLSPLSDKKNSVTERCVQCALSVLVSFPLQNDPRRAAFSGSEPAQAERIVTEHDAVKKDCRPIWDGSPIVSVKFYSMLRS